MTTLTQNEKAVFEAMLKGHEGDYTKTGWGDVYLDNFCPAGMSTKAYTGVLSSLSKKGLYCVNDNWAWGFVKLGESE